MKTPALILLCVLVTAFCRAQNLVPNPSFEEYDICPTGPGQLYKAKHWRNPIAPLAASSPDYYNSCNTAIYFGVPINSAGYEYARSGSGYCVIGTGAKSGQWVSMSANFREYLNVRLNDTMQANEHYCIEFYVSACDSFNAYSSNLGIYFSDDSISEVCPTSGCNLPFVPQFENPTSNILNSHHGWTRISGTYQATGGEEYITIGNFRDSTNTTLIDTNWTSILNRGFSAYYVDDVSITKCSTTAIEAEDAVRYSTPISPNPATTKLYCNNRRVKAGLYNLWGEEILPLDFTQSGEVDIANVPNGLYVVSYVLDGRRYSVKQVVMH